MSTEFAVGMLNVSPWVVACKSFTVDPAKEAFVSKEDVVCNALISTVVLEAAAFPD